MSTKQWVLKKQSWRGPADKSWRVRDDAEMDLKAVWSSHGRLTQITLPLKGQSEHPVNLVYHDDSGFYRGSIPTYQLLVLLEVNETTKSMRGIFYSFKEGPVAESRAVGVTDPEPIGIWGAEEREGNEWPVEP